MVGLKNARLVALLLCGVLVFTNVVTPTFAEEDGYEEEEKGESYVHDDHVHTADGDIVFLSDTEVTSGNSEDAVVNGGKTEVSNVSVSSGDGEVSGGPSGGERNPSGGPSGEDRNPSGGPSGEDQDPSGVPFGDAGGTEEPSESVREVILAPEITVKRAEGDATMHSYWPTISRDIASSYCKSPTITITAQSGTLAKVTVNGIERELSPQSETEYTFLLDFDGDFKDVLSMRVVAENSYGKTTSLKIWKHANTSSVGETIPIRRVTKQATCNLPGESESAYICKYCGAEFGVVQGQGYSALGHHFVDGGEIKATIHGTYRKQVCQTCGFELTTMLAESESVHNYETVTVDPVSAVGDDNKYIYKEGYTYKRCKDCGFVEVVENIAEYPQALEHKHRFGNWGTNSQRGTCVTPSYDSRVCRDCGYREYWNRGNGMVTFHKWLDNWIVIKEPDCGQPGLKERKCANCTEVQREVIPATGQHDYQAQVTKEPTCTAEGERTYTCSVCGNGYKEELDPTGHDYEEKITKEPSCIEEGAAAYTCTKCGDTRSIALPKTAHVPYAEDHDCTTAVECSVCHQKLSDAQLSHNFTGEYVTTEAGHSRKCVNPGCQAVSEAEAHYAEDDGDCTTALYCVCGWRIKEAKRSHVTPPQPWYGNQWELTETRHVLICTNDGCEVIAYAASHRYGKGWISNGAGGHYHECVACLYRETAPHNMEMRSDENYHWQECTECGYTSGRVLHDMEPLRDDAGHWKACGVCGYVDETSRAAHTLPENDDHNCLTGVECECGYVLVPAQSAHVFAANWEHDKDSHWHTCLNPDCQVKDSLTSHTPGEPIRVNEVFAACEDGGSYEELIICTECGLELSRETKFTDALGHSWVEEFRNPASCFEDGYIEYHCEICDSSKEEVLTAPKEHTWTEWKDVTAPDCDDTGVRERRCTVCGAIDEIISNPNGHDWKEESTIDQEPTCTLEGSQSIHCKNCEAVKPGSVESIPSLGHQFTNYVYDVGSATCTQDGSKTAPCENGCGVKHTIPAPGTMLEHQMSGWDIYESPTCTEVGSEARRCATCNLIEINEIPATGHDFRVSEEVEPDCLIPGWIIETCNFCGEVQETEVAAPGHQWTEWAVAKAPGCEEKGSETRSCSVCNEIESRIIEAIGHAWSDPELQWAEDYSAAVLIQLCENDASHVQYENDVLVTADVMPATCAEPGKTTYTATVTLSSGEVYTESVEVENLPALGHQFGDWTYVNTPTCDADGGEQRVCEVCGFVETRGVAASGHAWEENYTVDKAPTCLEDGSKSIHCRNCNAVKDSTVIPALGHSFTHYVLNGDGSETAKCDRCDQVNTRYTDIVITDDTKTNVKVDMSGLDLNDIVKNFSGRSIEIVITQEETSEENVGKLQEKVETGYEPLGSYEIRMLLHVDGEETSELKEGFGSVHLNLLVGTEYAGKSVIVYQLHDGEVIDHGSQKVGADGSVTIVVDRLSTFLVAAQSEESGNPGEEQNPGESGNPGGEQNPGESGNPGEEEESQSSDSEREESASAPSTETNQSAEGSVSASAETMETDGFASPATGDGANLLLWSLILALAVLMSAAALGSRRIRK